MSVKLFPETNKSWLHYFDLIELVQKQPDSGILRVKPKKNQDLPNMHSFLPSEVAIKRGIFEDCRNIDESKKVTVPMPKREIKFWTNLEEEKIIRLNQAGFLGPLRHAPINKEYKGLMKNDNTKKEDGSFFVMKYIDGPTFAEYFKDPSRSIYELADVIYGVLSSLDVAHKEGIIHRDLGSWDILLGHNEYGSLKTYISDLGVAVELKNGEQKYRSKDFAGKPYYVPPEVVDFKDGYLTWYAASDIYSLGLVLLNTARFGYINRGQYFSNGIDSKFQWLREIKDVDKKIRAVVREKIQDPKTSQEDKEFLTIILKFIDPNPHSRPTAAGGMGMINHFMSENNVINMNSKVTVEYDLPKAPDHYLKDLYSPKFICYGKYSPEEISESEDLQNLINIDKLEHAAEQTIKVYKCYITDKFGEIGRNFIENIEKFFPENETSMKEKYSYAKALKSAYNLSEFIPIEMGNKFITMYQSMMNAVN